MVSLIAILTSCDHVSLLGGSDVPRLFVANSHGWRNGKFRTAERS